MILNLTQHPATAEQRVAGVVDFEGEDLQILKSALNFAEMGISATQQANTIALLANRVFNDARVGRDRQVMIGGLPRLMGPLERALRRESITPLYAFSRRESVERTLEDGKVVKTAVFVHLGFEEGEI